MAASIPTKDYDELDDAGLIPGQGSAVVNDPSAPNGSGLYVAFEDGTAKRLATADELHGGWSTIYCKDGEFDAESGEPTIAAREDTMYMTPDGDGWKAWTWHDGAWSRVYMMTSAIGTDDIVDGAITSAKLDKSLRDSLSQGLVSSPHGEKINIWSDGSGYITIMLTAPGGVWRRVNIMKDGRLLWTDSTS